MVTFVAWQSKIVSDSQCCVVNMVFGASKDYGANGLYPTQLSFSLNHSTQTIIT